MAEAYVATHKDSHIIFLVLCNYTNQMSGGCSLQAFPLSAQAKVHLSEHWIFPSLCPICHTPVQQHLLLNDNTCNMYLVNYHVYVPT